MDIYIKNTDLLFLTIHSKNIYYQILVLKAILNDGLINKAYNINIINYNYTIEGPVKHSYVIIDGRRIYFHIYHYIYEL